MAALSLQERVPVKNTLWRASDLGILLLLVSFLYYRLSTLHHHGLLWFSAFLCESWFTFIWLLNMNAKWSPVKYITHPERISKRHEDLPAVDMFVTTADPKLEPPLMTMNTVLSLLAVEYPAHKLSCYVSDDGCSPITYHALVEGAEFARSWVPFCKKYNVKVRAPFVYFSTEPEPSPLLSSDFLRDWQVMKNKYEELVRRIEAVAQTRAPLQFMKEEVASLSKFERGNHPSIVKVIWENKDSEVDGIPHLIYVAREKRPKHPHHYKAGAMNVLEEKKDMQLRLHSSTPSQVLLLIGERAALTREGLEEGNHNIVALGLSTMNLKNVCIRYKTASSSSKGASPV